MVAKQVVDERRQHMRLDMEGELVDLIWQNQAQNVTERVICVDFSRKGMKVKSQKKIDLYTRVEIVLNPEEAHPVNLKARVIRNLIDRNGDNEVAMLFHD